VFALAPVEVRRQCDWAGSDDGLIHVTKDGGKSWANVTPHRDAGLRPRQHSRCVGVRRRHACTPP
jgi:photosystem II stability/assembly factor-like uncharacterized protein